MRYQISGIYLTSFSKSSENPGESTSWSGVQDFHAVVLVMIQLSVRLAITC